MFPRSTAYPITANKNSTLLDHFSLATEDLRRRRTVAERLLPMWAPISPLMTKFCSAKLVFRVPDLERTKQASD